MTVSLLKQKEVNDISDSLHLEKCIGEDCVEFGRAVPTQSLSTINRNSCSKDSDVKQDIPDELLSLLSKNLPFGLPYYLSTQVQAIMKGLIVFSGTKLISMNDLQSLLGNKDSPQDKWLTYFVVDEYLKLIQCASEGKNVKAKTLSWEIFEKGHTLLVARHLQQDESPFIQDLILLPCNTTHSKHWFLVVVLPKKKVVIALDSVPGDFVKPTMQKALDKMS